MKKLDLVGRTFGRLTVVSEAQRSEHGKTRWVCSCSCGNTVTVVGSDLKGGKTKSCGCFQSEARTTNHAIHNGTNTRLFNIWKNMRQRCLNHNNPRYGSYGGSGIAVCHEWASFERFRAWALANGYSDELSLDRIDNYSGYTPENCRWVKPVEQSKNKRSTVRYQGKCLADVCREKNLHYKAIARRIQRGWDVERAVNTPVNTKN